MEAHTTELPDRSANDEKAIQDVLPISSVSGTTRSNLETVPAEVQQEIFRHYFQSFEIEVPRTYLPYSDRSWYGHNASRLYPGTRVLAWSSSPGPLSLVLTSRCILTAALPLMDSHVTRSLHQAMDKADQSRFLPLAEVDFAHHAPLVQRIETIHVDDVWTLQEVCALRKSGRNMLEVSLQLVEMDCDIRDPVRKLDTEDVRKLEEAVDSVILEMSSNDEAPIQSFGPRCDQSSVAQELTTALARNLFDCDSRQDHLRDTLWWEIRWFDLKLNVKADSRASQATLFFTALLPLNKCQKTCPAKTLEGSERDDWRERRMSGKLLFNCNCIMVEKLRVISHTSTKESDEGEGDVQSSMHNGLDVEFDSEDNAGARVGSSDHSIG